MSEPQSKDAYVPDRERHGQWVSDSILGDCHRACMSVLLDVPNGPHLPTPDAEQATNGKWATMWRDFLADLGLAVRRANANGPIWAEHPWIASVPSLNFPGCGHSIVMHQGGHVLFDPSPAKRYEGNLIGQDVVFSGEHLAVADASRIHRLVAFQDDHRTEREWSERLDRYFEQPPVSAPKEASDG
jgi:hypothetical protein